MIKQIENNKYSLESNDYQLSHNRNPVHQQVPDHSDNSLLRCLTQSKSKKGVDQTVFHRLQQYEANQYAQ